MSSHYDIAFVGLGSIGTRHFHNVCSLLDSRKVTYNIDLYRSNIAKSLPSEVTSKVRTQYSFHASLADTIHYDIVFVTNPTSLHYNTILKFCGHTRSMFIEKPVFDSTDVDASVFSRLNDTIAYVACPLRYNAVLQYIKDNINYQDAISVRSISSSYLPDWRPNQDYRTCYSAHCDMGGGVAIDLIHEWDYLTFFFGMPDSVHSIQDRISNLEIDSDDIAIYIAKAGRKTIELHLDYFGRKTLRSMDLLMPDDTIHCDIANGYIEYMNSGRKIKFEEERNSYQMKEIEHFFDIVEGKANNDSDMTHAYNVLKLTKGI